MRSARAEAQRTRLPGKRCGARGTRRQPPSGLGWQRRRQGSHSSSASSASAEASVKDAAACSTTSVHPSPGATMISRFRVRRRMHRRRVSSRSCGHGRVRHQGERASGVGGRTGVRRACALRPHARPRHPIVPSVPSAPDARGGTQRNRLPTGATCAHLVSEEVVTGVLALGRKVGHERGKMRHLPRNDHAAAGRVLAEPRRRPLDRNSEVVEKKVALEPGAHLELADGRFDVLRTLLVLRDSSGQGTATGSG